MAFLAVICMGGGGGGGQNVSPPNLAISSQMTMKFGRSIFWVQISTNLQKVLIL